MTIQVGERIPNATLQYVENGVQKAETSALFAGKKTVLFAVPGAFTPTCSERHLPGYIAEFDAFKAKGVDVACMAVNDAFVMQAWGKSQHAPDGLRMLADGNAEFSRAMGLEMDISGYGMGMRSKRFAMLIDDGVVQKLWVEAPGEFHVSSAEHVLAELGA